MVVNDSKESKNWITIKNIRNKGMPTEIRINKNGDIFVDGEQYDETNTKYKNMSVDVEKHNKINFGEDTQKMIASSKEAEKGETKVIEDIKDKNKRETTTVKF
ncbi:hypothetical protein GGQ84_001525 [Desulfitispora alkaliphila]|uniref:hypothetical protein n=1 Tax=Desulfitispora alkaliphila TaxID=622674 RepID=UPI003D1E2BE2